MKHFQTLQFVVILTLLCGSSSAHQDTTIDFQKGKLIGLPETYLPASFDKKELSLTIAGKKIVFPEVLQRLLTHDVRENPDPFEGDPQMELIPCKFSFSASWYHDDSDGSLPPYMLIKITPDKAPCQIELLIDMQKLKFLRSSIIVNGLGEAPIDINKSGYP